MEYDESIICRSCDSGARLFPQSKRIRSVWTKEGKIQDEINVLKCPECGKHDSATSELAPKGSRYDWDIIGEIITLKESGLSYHDVSVKLAVDYGVKASVSGVFGIYHKYRRHA